MHGHRLRGHAKSRRKWIGVHAADIMGMHNSLGQTGGSAAVHDVKHIIRVNDNALWLLIIRRWLERMIIQIPGVVCPVGQNITIFSDYRQFRFDAVDFFNKLRIGNERDRIWILQQCSHRLLKQQCTCGHDNGPDFRYGPINFEQLKAVWKNRGDLVSFLNA